MPRLRKYASTIVPEIGCDMANSRRADSADPVGSDDPRCPAAIDRLRSRKLEEASRLIGHVAKVGEAATLRG